MPTPPTMSTPSRLILTRAPDTAIDTGTSAPELNIITLITRPIMLRGMRRWIQVT